MTERSTMAVPLVLVLLLSISIRIEGQSTDCVAPNGRQGNCISIQNCPSIQQLYSSVLQGAASFGELRQYICRIERQPFICCVPEFTPVAPQTPSTPVRTPSQLPTQCGTQGLIDQIVNGDPAPLRAWPWMVILRGTDTSTGRGSWICGGTLISDRYVLTAAHCLDGRNEIRLDFARIGEHTLQQDPDCSSLGACAPQPQDIPVERIINHPSYNTPCNECNDITLLRLSRNAVIDGSYVQPVCLTSNPRADLGSPVEEIEGKLAWATGWGTISRDPRFPVRPNVLHQVQLKLQTLPFCTRVKRAYPNQSMVFCAGGDNDGKDTCRGYSGGPLLMENNNKYYLIGITSKGPHVCGADNTQGVYTNVHHYMPWILQNIQP